MKSSDILNFFLLFFIHVLFAGQVFSQLKSIVYDFDGLHIDQTNLPDSDYKLNDLTYKVVAYPIDSKEVLGDRVLEMNLNWNLGNGSFGRKIERYIELNPSSDILNFYFYNPLSNNQDATVDVLVSEDDDQSNIYDYNKDDLWIKNLSIGDSSGWQLISIPLSNFSDSNTGGNGVFDATFSGNKGMVLKVEFKFNKNSTSLSNPVFYIDMICFSDGHLSTGATVFDLPSKNESDYCLLGAYASAKPDLIPGVIENVFPSSPEKKLKFVNWFIQFATDGTTTAKNLPGDEVKTLLNNGYRSIITWEPMFKSYSRLDPVQPRLDDIINGDYNSYIDAFADKLKSYNDTIIIRFMHEFDGDWYSWSLVENGHDPNKYIAAFRKVVDRVRARGATKVQWMWCTNGDYFPRRSYNWIVPAYPGDNYVDIVATDIYNNHTPTELPDWKSFKLKAVETYYYLSKYFPQKPLFICELGCRERYSNENTSSEKKDAWLARMDKELQSNFSKVRALVFFSSFVAYDWRVNSSSATINSIASNIWNDDYYFKIPTTSALTAKIISPANNSTFHPDSTIIIKATASGGGGPIQKVEFFEGTTKLGEDFSSPYSYTWNNVSIGNYTLTAKATDSVGDTFTSPIINIKVDTNSNHPCSATGNITRDKWSDFSGKNLAEIPVNTTPTSTSLLSLFEGPINNGDNYASRIRGYICPPVSGDYVFWIASDNNSALYLSSSDDPNTKVKIAQQDLSTSSRQWTKYANQKSLSISLIAGQRYYIEALHREGSLGDNLAVGWQLPNGTLERPIPGNRLSPTTAALIAKIISPANNSTFHPDSTIIIKATASGGGGPIQKVEFFEGTTKLGEDFSSPYSYTWNNVSIGNYTLTAKTTDSVGDTFTSPIINIKVDTNSNHPCSATGNITRDRWSNFSGKILAEIPVNTTPTSTSLLSLFEGPINNGDNYASRIRGYICPPISGNYVFWIASDNNSALYLSSSDDPNTKVKIAQQDFNTSSRQWTKYANQKSQPISLIAGQSYYIEVLHREGSLGDNLAVGWQLPNGTLERPIPGNRLSPFQVGSALALKPNAFTVPQITVTGPLQISEEAETILFTEWDSSAIFQWKINGSIIPMSNKNILKATFPGLYQVKVIKNGTISVSGTVEIIGNQKTDTIHLPNSNYTKGAIEDNDILKVFPNPNTGLFTIVVCMPASELAKIHVMNNLGQTVYSKEIIIQNNCINETIEIDKSVPAGIYTLKIIIGNKIENTNVVLVR